MRHSDRMNKTLAVWALLLALGPVGAGLVGAAQPAAGDPLRIVPADALFCLRVNRFMTTLSQVDQFLTGISPFGASMPVRSQLGRFLGQPEPAGLNLTGDVAVFWPLPGGEKPERRRVGALIPLSDFQQFLTNPNVAPPDAQGIVTIGPEDQRTLAGVQVGNYLLVARTADRQALVEAKNWAAGPASLGQRLGPNELQRATGSGAWVYANVQIANKMYGPQLQEKIREAQKHLQQMQPRGQTMPVQPEAMMQMGTTVLRAFLEQTQFVSLSLDPSATAIRLAPLLAAVPNTEMARILGLGGRPEKRVNLSGYMENGAITTGITNFSPELVRAIMQMRAELAVSLMGQTVPAEDLARFRKLADESAEVFDGSAAWALLPDLQGRPPLRLRYVAGIRDRQRFNEVLDQLGKLMGEDLMANLGQPFGLKLHFHLNRKAETYNEVPIDAVTIGIEPIQPDTPQGQMLKAMYGEGLNLRLAVVENLLLYTLAADPQKEIRALIDRAQAGPGAAPSEVQAALQLIPEAQKANFFGTYNYLRALQMALAVLPIPVAPADLQTQSNIAFAGDIGNGRLLMNVAFPKQHALEVVSVLMRMQQKRMEQQMPPGPPPAQPQPGQPGETSS